MLCYKIMRRATQTILQLARPPSYRWVLRHCLNVDHSAAHGYPLQILVIYPGCTCYICYLVIEPIQPRLEPSIKATAHTSHQSTHLTGALMVAPAAQVPWCARCDASCLGMVMVAVNHEGLMFHKVGTGFARKPTGPDAHSPTAHGL